MKALQRLLKGRAKRAKKFCFALQTYFVRHIYLINAAAEDEEDITRVQDHDGAEMMAHESRRLAPGPPQLHHKTQTEPSLWSPSLLHPQQLFH